MKQIYLFCDGSCLKNPGVGGWAYILEFYNNEKKHIKKQSGGSLHTTNNQMELTAAINGLKALKEPCKVKLYTDSSYVSNGINIWLKNWQLKNYKNVKNKELWEEIAILKQIHSIEAFWIKGHNGHPQNEECDKMARNEAEILKS